jgi:outer membrane protein assembly factor BamE (lipoprotein component of BamABCDE complex)
MRMLCFCSLVVLAFAQPGAVVTNTMTIRIDGKPQRARQINGRWWSNDNRELIHTSEKWLWTISGGNARHLVRFDHHRPVDPSKVNLLDRSMGPDQVRAIMGDPNSVFPSDKPEQHQHWDYYGSNGYKVSIFFAATQQSGIFTASYQPDPHVMPKDVDHLVFRFSGKSARETFEERKLQPKPGHRTRQPGETIADYRARLLEDRASAIRGTSLPPPITPESAPVPISRKLTDDEVKSIEVGVSKTKLLELLGDPASRSSINGGDGTRETFRYPTASGSTVTIIVIDGKVSERPRSY